MPAPGAFYIGDAGKTQLSNRMVTTATPPAEDAAPVSPRARLAALLPRLVSPTAPLLHGRTGGAPILPDNIICFRRTEAAMLNGEHRGRFLHHRFTLMFALESAVTVCVDHAAFRLGGGMGLLVFPFQFHHYARPESEKIRWLFVTFELPEADRLKALLNRPFVITAAIHRAAADLVGVYLDAARANLIKLHLSLLLEHMADAVASGGGGWMARVNRLAEGKRSPFKAKELAGQLGVSISHLRTQFQQSSGISLGRHLRMLRLERACGLLRLSNARVTEIAEESGFSSVYVFSRTFRHAYGVPPLAYRKRFAAAADKSATETGSLGAAA